MPYDFLLTVLLALTLKLLVTDPFTGLVNNLVGFKTHHKFDLDLNNDIYNNNSLEINRNGTEYDNKTITLKNPIMNVTIIRDESFVTKM